MPERCELLEQCGFFRNFTSNLETIKQRWIQLFCENAENSALCERKKIRMETGKPPADNVSPIGSILNS
jgi:hypothetical protein